MKVSKNVPPWCLRKPLRTGAEEGSKTSEKSVIKETGELLRKVMKGHSTLTAAEQMKRGTNFDHCIEEEVILEIKYLGEKMTQIT